MKTSEQETARFSAPGTVESRRKDRHARACGHVVKCGVPGAAAGLLVLAGSGPVLAQETSELITTDLPFPKYVAVRDDHYGLRIGKLQVRYDLSVENVFTDNRNFSSSDKQSDYGIRPTLTFGLFYPVNDRQKLQLDVGLGYQWWANVSEQNRFYIAPRSHLSYVVGIGDVDVSLSNTTASTSEASSRVEFAGGPGGQPTQGGNGTDVAFNRISNTTSVGAGWKPGRIGFGANYGFTFDRTLTDQFQSLDQNRNNFGASVDYSVTAPITVGLAGNYSIYTYLENIQNDGTGYSVTPTLKWRLQDNLSLDAAVGYGQSDFKQTGTIQDNEGFAGVTFDVGAKHQINKAMNHSVRFSRNADPGLGSNFTDRFVVSYNLSARVSPVLTPFVGFMYESASLSGTGGEKADLFRINLGAGYPIFRRGTLGLNYGLTWRVTDDAAREYTENRVSLVASYRF